MKNPANILIKALKGLSMPLGRYDYTVAELNSIVTNISKNALKEYRIAVRETKIDKK